MRYHLLLSLGCAAGFAAAKVTESFRTQIVNLATRSLPFAVDDASSATLVRRTPMRGSGRGRPNQNQPPPAGRGRGGTRSSGHAPGASDSPPATPGPRRSTESTRRQNSSPGRNSIPRSNFLPPAVDVVRQQNANRGRRQSAAPPNRNTAQTQSTPPQNTNRPVGLQRQPRQGSGLPSARASTGTPSSSGHTSGNTARMPARMQPPAQAAALSIGTRGHYVTGSGPPGRLNIAQSRRPIPSVYPYLAFPAESTGREAATAGALVPHAPSTAISTASASGSHGAVTMLNVPHGSRAEVISLRDGSPPRRRTITPGNQPTVFDQRAPNGRMTQHRAMLIGPGSVISEGISVPTRPDGTPGPISERLQQVRSNPGSLSAGYAAPAA